MSTAIALTRLRLNPSAYKKRASSVCFISLFHTLMKRVNLTGDWQQTKNEIKNCKCRVVDYKIAFLIKFVPNDSNINLTYFIQWSAWILIAIYACLCLQVSADPWWGKDDHAPVQTGATIASKHQPIVDHNKSWWWWGHKYYDYKKASKEADDLYKKKWDKYGYGLWGKPWWWWKKD